MANWSSLKSLKIHKAVLKIIAVILVVILIFTPKNAFRTNRSNPFFFITECTSTVVAYSGLSIRDQPNKRGNLLITVPYKAKLTILEKDIALDNINGKSGYWYKVDYQGTKGFAFGNFIRNK